MLTDNAITYPQDRASREWTYNYYMEAAKHSLLILAKEWPEVERALLKKQKGRKGASMSSRRWDKYQFTLQVALVHFGEELGK